jgi:hypothetical protein
MSFFHLQRAYWRRTPKRRQGRSPSYPGGSRRLLHPLSVPPRAAVAPTQRPCAHRAEQRRRRLCSSSRPMEGGREVAASADLRGGQGSTAAPPPTAVGRGRTSLSGAPTRAREDEPRVAPPPPGSAGPRASIRRDLHILRRRSRGVAELADLLPIIVLTEARFVEQGTPRPPRSEVALLHARRARIR